LGAAPKPDWPDAAEPPKEEPAPKPDWPDAAEPPKEEPAPKPDWPDAAEPKGRASIRRQTRLA